MEVHRRTEAGALRSADGRRGGGRTSSPRARRSPGASQRICGRSRRASRSANRQRRAQPDAATVQRLQALGYVGAFAPVTSGKAGADPKDHIADYRAVPGLFNRALGLLGRGHGADAATLLQQLLKSNVRAFEAHLYLGNAYFVIGRHDAALAEYEIASQLNPALASPYFEAAKALSAKGDPAAAAARARRGLEIEPESFYGRYTLGVVFQRAGQWGDALTEFRRAVELNGSDPRARANLASAVCAPDDLELARTQFEAMIELGTRWRPPTTTSASSPCAAATAPRRSAGTSSRCRQTRRSSRPAKRWQSSNAKKWILALVASGCLLRALASRGSGPDAGTLSRGVGRFLNVLIITLDTMRGDRVGAYGDSSAVDAQPRSAGAGRGAVRAGDHRGAADAAGALDAVHRAAAAAARRSGQRRLRARSPRTPRSRER